MSLIVFDLDEHLVHTCEREMKEFSRFRVPVAPREFWWCHVRPGAIEFLQHVRKRHKIGFWSAACDLYMAEVVDRLLALCGIEGTGLKMNQDPRWSAPVVLSWSRTKCRKENGQYVKHVPLICTGATLFDDNIVHSQHPENKGKVLKAVGFRGHPEDAWMEYYTHHWDTLFRLLRCDHAVAKPVAVRKCARSE